MIDNQQIQSVPSLISRDESAAIKGFLMLLIIFGHTGLLTTNFQTGERTFFWHWLYSFHVYIFFILPFIYGYRRKCPSSQNTKKTTLIDIPPILCDLKHNLLKIGVPYCWFFVISLLVFITVGKGQYNFLGVLYAFFFGNQPLMDQYIGFNFMWFLPAMLALTILKGFGIILLRR